MNNLLDIKTPAAAQAAARQERLWPGKSRPVQPEQGVLEPAGRSAVRRGHLPRRRRRSPAGGAIRRQHRQAHRPRRQRQVRGARADPPKATSGGASTTVPIGRRSSTSCSAACRASCRAGTLFVQDCYAGRRPELPPAGAHHHRAGLAQPVRPQHVHPAEDQRGIPPPRAGFHRDLLPVVQGLPADRRHPQQHGHRHQLRPAAVHHRQHRLRRRDQEVGLHHHELPAAAGGRDDHALLGQRGQATATWRCSSACRAPARPRCRPTRRAA